MGDGNWGGDMEGQGTFNRCNPLRQQSLVTAIPRDSVTPFLLPLPSLFLIPTHTGRCMAQRTPSLLAVPSVPPLSPCSLSFVLTPAQAEKVQDAIRRWFDYYEQDEGVQRMVLADKVIALAL